MLENVTLLLQAPYALSELAQLLALGAGQPVIALTAIALALATPVPQRLRRHPQALGDIRDRAALTDQLHRLPPERLRIGRPRLRHHGHPRVHQSGATDRRGSLSKHGPRYLRWGLTEAALNARTHPRYAARYQRTKHRLGRQRGAKIAQIELARSLAETIWHMLTRNQPFAPAGTGFRLAA